MNASATGFPYPAVSGAVNTLPGFGAGLGSGLGSGTGLDGGGSSFGEVLKSTLMRVNQLDTTAGSQVTGLLAGGGGDMSSVMIAVEKADVAFQLMMQVRNKIVTAYQDIEKMQF